MREYKIVNIRPHISDQEIEGTKSFKALAMEHDKMINKGSSNKSLWQNVIIGLGLAVMVGYFIFQSYDNKEIQQEIIIEKSNDIKNQPEEDALIAPKVDDQKEKEDKKTGSLQNTPLVSSSVGPEENKVTDEVSEQVQVSIDQGEVDHSDEVQNEIKENIYVQAEPVAGIVNLYLYFEEQLKYPQEAVKDSIEGTVVITFSINIEGKPENISVDKSPDERLNTEAIRLIQQMPDWKPATLNGKPLSSKMSIPVHFRIED